MLRTLPKTRDFTELQRVAMIAVFTLLMIIFTQIKIQTVPVPFTMQPFAVLQAGLVLSRRDGALAMATYVGLIALGFPVDSNNIGAAALAGPTAGYIFGFVLAAGVVGFLTERGAERFWLRFAAGLVGIAVIYVFGTAFLKFHLGVDWSKAWELGVRPFLGLDILKALIAAGLAEGTRRFLLQTLLPTDKMNNG